MHLIETLISDVNWTNVQDMTSGISNIYMYHSEGKGQVHVSQYLEFPK